MGRRNGIIPFSSRLFWNEYKRLCTYYVHIPLSLVECDAKSVFKQSTTGMNSEFFFYTGCLTKAKEPNLPNYFFMAGERTNGFMSFPRVLSWSEMQIALSRIGTWLANSISYNDNHCTKDAHSSTFVAACMVFNYQHLKKVEVVIDSRGHEVIFQNENKTRKGCVETWAPVRYHMIEEVEKVYF